MNRTAVVLMLAIAGATPLMEGCVKNAATGKRQLDLISRQDEIATGLDQGPKMTTTYGGEVPDQVLRDYVTRIGLKVAAGVEKEYKDIPWKFTLLNSDVINAFALPGGQVFMSRGLMVRMTNEAQLAGVLGHECGHVTAEHIDQRIAREYGLQIGAAALGAAGGQKYGQLLSDLTMQGGGLFSLKFGRAEESEADALGMRYMARAGYNPEGQLQVMEILRDASKGAGRQPEWLSTHPLPETRIKEIQKRLKDKYANTKNNPQYALDEAAFTPMLERLKKLPPAPKPPAQ